MFTAYLNTDAESEKKNKDKKETSGKTGTGIGTKKDADSTAKKTTKAGKSEKSGKTVKTGKGVAAESDVSAKQPKTTDPIQKDGLKETEGGVTFLKLSLVEPNREQPRRPSGAGCFDPPIWRIATAGRSKTGRLLRDHCRGEKMAGCQDRGS